MQGICTYIPETNNVPREYTVAALLLFLFMVPISLVSALVLLCFYVSTFRIIIIIVVVVVVIDDDELLRALYIYLCDTLEFPVCASGTIMFCVCMSNLLLMALL
jgi:hypothetical protein